jgi:hypothetical protein
MMRFLGRRPTVSKITQIDLQREGGVDLTISNTQYLCGIFEAYQTGLSVDGNEVPGFNYRVVNKNTVNITGDVRGVLSLLQQHGVLSSQCAQQYAQLDLPPSPFLEMQQQATPQGIICW